MSREDRSDRDPCAAALAKDRRLAVGAGEAARLLAISTSLFKKLHRTGRVPAPIRLGARCVWHVEELRAWVEAGAPERSRWDSTRASRGGSR